MRKRRNNDWKEIPINTGKSYSCYRTRETCFLEKNILRERIYEFQLRVVMAAR